MSELGGLVSLYGVTASRQRVLFARCMGALVTLFGGCAVTLGCSFMVIRSGDVCFFGHREVPLPQWLLHEGAQQAELRDDILQVRLRSCHNPDRLRLVWRQKTRHFVPFGAARQNHQVLTGLTAEDYSKDFAEANHLRFLEVQSRLSAGNVSNLDPLHACLQRDYKIITYFLRHALPDGPEHCIEHSLLLLQYRVMSVSFLITRSWSGAGAVGALQQMVRILTHLANTLGECRETAV